ncbi:MAG: ABC transporter permease [Chloroflexi bacterium]|nr:MAG: ABC transporter permease [Chloroflexota bacterium]TMC32858.1 MAG: ABC transporter permease [Chloroflexota bacterium]TME39196.1 MAG: ABC transporter permease [Chloroflexota bacterium]
MAKFVGARLLESIPVLVLSSLLVFSVLHLIPGDPVDAMLGVASFGVGDPELLKKQEEAIRLELGLNDPLPIQYLNWVGRALRGDLGQSYIRHAPVSALIAERLPSTIELAFTALVLSVVFGIGLGILAAIQRNSPLDRIVMLVSLGGVSTPSFFFAMLLILLLSVGLGLLPATGSGGLDRLIMPALVLGYNATGLIARLTRASLLEVLGREYITTARAKGLPFRLIIGRHAMRNALIPIVTIVGLQLGQLVAGSVIVETVFARQGIGQLAIDAILSKDYPVVQGVILLTASSYVVANLLVDISYGFINPRIRTS